MRPNIGPHERRVRRLLNVPDECPLGKCDGWGIRPSDGELCECTLLEQGAKMGRQQEIEALQSVALQLSQVASDLLKTSQHQRQTAEQRSLAVEVDKLTERLLHPRIVRVSYINERRIDLKRQWDYIDGIGNLRVGDRVITPRFQFPDCEAVVVAVDEPRQWMGRLKTIKERRLGEL